MSPQEKSYHQAASQQSDATESKLFGKLCYKINGKAFCCFFQECMVFKLNGDAHAKALALDGAQLFDPSGKGRPMKEWVQVPFEFKKEWISLAAAANGYLSE